MEREVGERAEGEKREEGEKERGGGGMERRWR